MIYRFGRFSIDPENYRLCLEGQAQTVEPQVFGVLAYLIENRDRIVTRDELINAVWDGRIVSDGTLTTRINAVRRAVGDNGTDQSVIKTLPRRGFRFVAPVTEDLKPSEASASAVSAGDPSVDVSAPVAGFGGRPAIVVLPFENVSNDPEQEFFVDGLSRTISHCVCRCGVRFP